MRKMVFLFTIILLTFGLIISAVGCQPEFEITTDVKIPVPVEDGILMEMHTETTMAGVGSHLTISADGSIVYFDDRGLRLPTEKNPAIRITRTGQLTKPELTSLLETVDACPFDAEGNCDARTEIIDTDAVSVLTFYYQGLTRTITANYQPFFHLFHPEISELTDVPEPVRTLYRQLKNIIDTSTSQVLEEAITPTGQQPIETTSTTNPTIGMGVLEGKVWIGPLPGGPPENLWLPYPPEIYQPRKIMVYDADRINLVKQVDITEIGYYRVELPAGVYTVDINHVGSDWSNEVPRKFTIKPDIHINADIFINITVELYYP